MLTFRMDETNFAEGDRAGVRIATGAGLKADFDEFSTDGQTLGLWHLHDGACQGEGTGLVDASGGGHDLANHGAESVEDGYHFTRADSDDMDAAFTGQPAHSKMTLETWVRGCRLAPPPGGNLFAFLAAYSLDTNPSGDKFEIYVRVYDDGIGTFIRTRLFVAGVMKGDTHWSGADAHAVVTGSAPWHVAAVFDADASPTYLRLYVNGVERGADTTDIVALSAGDYTFLLGRHTNGQAQYDFDGTLDEVRLSSAPRYTAAFTPYRLLASGAFTSVTFDATRLSAEWADLVHTHSVPQGCEILWDVRADDETDAGGDPQTVWQPYSGDPAALPDGRYFQWRATLSASDDHQVSPAIESVEAVASEAGYDLYHAVGAGPECLDYNEPWARVGPGVAEAQTDALAAASVHWFGIRPVDCDGRESPTAQDELRLETDAQGAQEPDRPAGPLAAAAMPLPLGAARLQWRYRVGLGGVLPQTFRIFGDGGTGTIDYDTPLGETPWRQGQVAYAWTSDPLAPGIEHQLAVRAVTAGEVWDEQPAVARLTPDAAPPGQVDALEAEIAP